MPTLLRLMGPCVREERKIVEIPWEGREILLPAAFLWWSRSERNDVFLRGERNALHCENWAAAAIRPAGKWFASESRYFGRHFVVFGRLPDIDTG